MQNSSIDIIFNGRYHYTIHMNIGIQQDDLLTGIDNLIDMILKKNTNKEGWTKKLGQKERTRQNIGVYLTEEDDLERFKEVLNKRKRKQHKAKKSTIESTTDSIVINPKEIGTCQQKLKNLRSQHHEKIINN